VRIGAFDTDSAALARRLEAHARFSSGDMTGWALELLGAGARDRVLELGCGTGNQTLRLAPAIGPEGQVVAVDASSESLAALRDAAAEAGVADRITTVEGRYDELAERTCDRRFTRALSCYALYYAVDERRVLGRVHELLEPGGVLFFCGPSRANNAELRRFHFDLAGTEPPPETPAQAFMERTGPEIAGELFATVERFTFENPMRFDSAEALHTYWSSYNLYDPALDERFRAAAAEHFAREPVFETVKRVVGVRAVKTR
jgi:SAM-dependent methyltransferase